MLVIFGSNKQNTQKIISVCLRYPAAYSSSSSAITISNELFAQEKTQMVRLAKLVIDSAQLELYNSYLKEEIEVSLKNEPGVLTFYAVSEKNNPTRITILENLRKR